MNVWLKNSIKNLLPLSEEKEDFKLAVKEWYFTGNIIDHEQPIESCRLCEHEDLRYHYEISNALLNVLWVGSKCIEKFDITVYDSQGNEISENKEAYLITQARKKHIKSALDKLIQTRPSDKIVSTNGPSKGESFPKVQLDEFCRNRYSLDNAFDARMLNYLFMRFDEEGLFYEKRFFTISLKSKVGKDKLLLLTNQQFERIKDALSTTQQNFYLEHK